MILLTDGGLSLGANVFGIVYGSVKFQRLQRGVTQCTDTWIMNSRVFSTFIIILSKNLILMVEASSLDEKK